MTDAPAANAPPAPSRDFRRLVALVVDDSAAQRRVLRLQLERWSFDVIEAPDGAAALALCRAHEIDFVICDWTMPGMSGPAFCRALRGLPLPHYIYIILLTARSDRDAVAEGLAAGADDFLFKPAAAGELHARLRAGERILTMQEDLLDKNRRLTEAFDRVSALHEATDRDLRAAGRLQRALLPPRQSRCGGAGVGVLWRPAGHVGGDLVGVSALSSGRVMAWAIDVSGHGVPSALMTARLAHQFAPAHPDESPAIRRLFNGAHVPRDPAALAIALNTRMLAEAGRGELYFTMLFADLDLGTGLVRFCQAGHPAPAVIRACGTVEFPGAGGPPVGLLPDAVWETETVCLAPGERLVLLTDGITDAENSNGTPFEAAALSATLSRTRHMAEGDQMQALFDAIAAYTAGAPPADDVSALALTVP